MEASDMLDILHVLYEEDNLPLYEEHQEIQSNLRVAMWRHLYESEYKFPYHGSTTPNAAGGLPPEDSLLPDEFAPKPQKPYFPPTDPEKLTEILDAPMGG